MATSKPVPGAAVAAGLCAHGKLAPGPASRPPATQNFSFWEFHRRNETAALACSKSLRKMAEKVRKAGESFKVQSSKFKIQKKLQGKGSKSVAAPTLEIFGLSGTLNFEL